MAGEKEAGDCSHRNAYEDDFLGHWHCDDCGAHFGEAPPGTPAAQASKEEADHEH